MLPKKSWVTGFLVETEVQQGHSGNESWSQGLGYPHCPVLYPLPAQFFLLSLLGLRPVLGGSGES
jgi:hypothetical protein